jgi:hypothetical protein
MKENVGMAESIFRMALGLFLLFEALVCGHTWGYLGVVPL